MFRALDLWLPAYLRQAFARPRQSPVTDLMVCVCDHFEPFHAADKSEALRRMQVWRRDFPRLINAFRDSDGCHPRHTFFYPIEQYDKDVIAELASICAETGAEVEIHLHHKDDDEEKLRHKLEQGKSDLLRHGLLSRDASGAERFGFIHGDWALANSHPEGKHCGVNRELSVLRNAGCYADFTLPSAPSGTQTRIINSLYYAKDTGAPKPHDCGELAKVNGSNSYNETGDSLLIVQGPLGLNWERRKWGVLPRIENGDLTGANPPTPERLRVWSRLGISVSGQPEWAFVKLHTHGGIPQNYEMLLGDPMRRYFQHLEDIVCHGAVKLHYVTARELVNLVHAAELGKKGSPGQYRDQFLKRH